MTGTSHLTLSYSTPFPHITPQHKLPISSCNNPQDITPHRFTPHRFLLHTPPALHPAAQAANQQLRPRLGHHPQGHLLVLLPERRQVQKCGRVCELQVSEIEECGGRGADSQWREIVGGGCGTMVEDDYLQATDPLAPACPS